ncbi:MAG: ABC transporter permease subunit [Deltaproteobacteria bacterium]|nr:MAG: ABC transporter permease subunit [Deltaproteobacteria bacterium]
MAAVRRHGFSIYLLAGLGAAVACVVAIVAVQLAYTTEGERPIAALREADVRHAVQLSLWTSTASALVALAVALPASYALARWRFRGKVVVDALLDIPIVLSPVVIGVALILVFRSAPGRWVEANVVRFVFEVPGIIAAQFVLALALQIRVLKAAFEDLDPRYEQVARFLGCTPWGAFWRVALPMCRTSLLAAFVLGWARALGDFGASVTVAGSVRNKTETIPVAIYNNLASVQIGKALGLALLLTLVAMAVLVVVRVVGARRSA